MNRVLQAVVAGVVIQGTLIVSTELVLRLIFPDKLNAFQTHPDYLLALKPNVSKTFLRNKGNGGQSISWHVNSDGFRGPQLKDAPAHRIIVYGDSMIQARWSNLEQTFAWRLQHYLQRKSLLDVEVVNSGIVGFGPDQSLLKFMSEVKKYKPDTVVHAIFADNDFGDIIRNRLFELDSSGRLVRVPKRAGEYKEFNTWSDFASRLLIVKAVRLVFRKVGIGNDSNVKSIAKATRGASPEELTQQMLDQNLWEFENYKNGGGRKVSNFADRYDVDVSLFPVSEAAKTKIALMRGVLIEFHKQARREDVKYVVAIIPSVNDLAKNLRPNFEHFQKFPEYKRETLTSAIEQICRRNGIPYVNLFQTFADNTPSKLYFAVDELHWNDAGQDLAAEQVSLYVSRTVNE